MNRHLDPRISAAVGSAVLLMLGACATGPDYARPALDTPGAYKEAAETEKAQPQLALDWWRLFSDPDLNALEEDALAANHDIRAAIARVEQARASTMSVRSAFFPVISASPAITRARTPASTQNAVTPDSATQAATTIGQVAGIINQINNFGQGGTGSGTIGGGTSTTATGANISQTYTRIQLPFDLSYELDIWGRVRRQYESAKAQGTASVYDLEVVRQTVIADIAQNYFNLRALDARLAILDRNLALYRDEAKLTRMQFQTGLADETTPLQASVQLQSTLSQEADIRRQRADLEHAIATLLGKAPSDFSLSAKPLNAVPPTIPAGLPGDLLRRRPDVAEAEQNLAAACADIGVAQADFFPTVTLTGSTGFQSSDFTTLLASGGLAWSIGPNINVPIFKGGQLRANLQKARARYDELEAVYRKSVLTAFADVENSLNDLHERADAATAQNKAVEDAREYLRLTQLQYQTGVKDYLNVIVAEKTLLTNELANADISGQRMVSTVLLIKALGGGWEAAEPLVSGTRDSSSTS